MRVLPPSPRYAIGAHFAGLCVGLALLLPCHVVPAETIGEGGGFAPPSAGTPQVTNPSRAVPTLRNAPANPTRVEIRNQPSHPVNKQLRLTAPEIATPTPGVPAPPTAPKPLVPSPLLGH